MGNAVGQIQDENTSLHDSLLRLGRNAAGHLNNQLAATSSRTGCEISDGERIPCIGIECADGFG